MKNSIYQIDAFTDTIFGGNPACVVPLNNWLSDEILLKIAKENAVAETAFFVYNEDKIHLRWFTPEIEMDLCGHATLATAHCLSTILNYNKNEIVWCFIGDMTFETGTFMENYKYIKNFDLPVRFVVEDNGVSTNTPTIETWGNKGIIPSDVVYYEYEKQWPHYGTGKWVVF